MSARGPQRVDSLLTPDRYYRLAGVRWGRMLTYVIVIGGSVFLIADYAARRGHVSIPLVAWCVICTMVLLWWDRRFGRCIGLEERGDVFVEHQTISTRSVPMNDVVEFVARRDWPHVDVVGLMQDGERWHVASLRQKRLVRWIGGETRDVVSELNRRLRERA